MGPGLTKPKEGNQHGFSIRADFKYRGKRLSTEASEVPKLSSNFSQPQIICLIWGKAPVKALNLGRK